MLLVGLTGGIGAGKSAVARRLVERGAVLIDADVLAREVVAPGTAGLAEITEAFGSGVLTSHGELDRPALAAKVFGDTAARRRLEAIVHPRVRARTGELTRAAGPAAIVVNDVPLLVETGLAATYHVVLVVAADRKLRIQRLTTLRGMTEDEAAARIDAQADDARRLAAADVVLTNDADLDDLNERVDRLWRDRLTDFERNIRMRQAAPAGAAPLVDPDPTWPSQAQRLIGRIRHALGESADVAHIGATAVPGVPAADVIDLMLTVRTLAEADALADRLAVAGFPARPGEWNDNVRGRPGVTWPKRLHGAADPGRPVHLNVRVAGSPGWRFALLMRDHLRAVPQARAAYVAAKLRWAAERGGHGPGGGYGPGSLKEPWLDEEARAADDWAEATGWQPA